MESLGNILFGNIGGNLKLLALLSYLIGIVGSIIGGIVLIALDSPAPGLLTILGGTICSCIGSCTIYGFGQLIENTDTIVKSLSHKNDVPVSVSSGKETELDLAEKIEAAMNNYQNIPYWCSECGQPGPYEGDCPECKSEHIIENPHFKK